jgi:signal transduction histidine kinase
MSSKASSKIRAAAPEPREAGRLEAQISRLSLRYTDMLRSSVDWLWETDGNLKVTYVSPSIAKALGVPAQLLAGRGLFEVLGLREDELAGGRIAAAVAARRAFRDANIVVEGDDGGAPGYRMTGVPFYDGDTGGFAGYRGTGTALRGAADRGAGETDTAATLLHLLQAALARKDQLEWELSQAGDQAFQTRLAGIAHELRTPLNAIIGFAQVIQERHLGDDSVRYQDYARNIHESGLHMLEVVNDLLDLARIDAGHQALESESLEVETIVASALRMLADKAQEAEVLLVNEIPSGLPKVRGEKHALRQILLNLLTNAIKYTPSGGSAGIEIQTEGAGMLNVTVWDTGVGIALDEQERVFERAYRVPQTGLDRPGSGLGLAISRNLARAMGGDITIASNPGKGSRVTLRLPLDRDPAQRENGFS